MKYFNTLLATFLCIFLFKCGPPSSTDEPTPKPLPATGTGSIPTTTATLPAPTSSVPPSPTSTNSTIVDALPSTIALEVGEIQAFSSYVQGTYGPSANHRAPLINASNGSNNTAVENEKGPVTFDSNPTGKFADFIISESAGQFYVQSVVLDGLSEKYALTPTAFVNSVHPYDTGSVACGIHYWAALKLSNQTIIPLGRLTYITGNFVRNGVSITAHYALENQQPVANRLFTRNQLQGATLMIQASYHQVEANGQAVRESWASLRNVSSAVRVQTLAEIIDTQHEQGRKYLIFTHVIQ